MVVVVCVQTHSCRDAYVEVRGQLWGLGLSFHCGFQGPNSGRQACSTSTLPTKSSHCPHKTFLKHASTYSCNNHAHLHPNLLFISFGKMIVKTGLGSAQACGDTLRSTIWYTVGGRVWVFQMLKMQRGFSSLTFLNGSCFQLSWDTGFLAASLPTYLLRVGQTSGSGRAAIWIEYSSGQQWVRGQADNDLQVWEQLDVMHADTSYGWKLGA